MQAKEALRLLQSNFASLQSTWTPAKAKSVKLRTAKQLQIQSLIAALADAQRDVDTLTLSNAALQLKETSLQSRLQAFEDLAEQTSSEREIAQQYVTTLQKQLDAANTANDFNRQNFDREAQRSRDLVSQLTQHQQFLQSPVSQPPSYNAAMTEPAITAGTIVNAVDTVLSSFHSTAAREKFLVFSGGTGDTKTIYEWFRHSERLAKPFRWRDVDKIQYLSDKLEGPALHFHSAIWSDNLAQDLRTYAEWKKRMIAGFVTIADKDAERKRLQEITQIDGQRVRDYIYKLDAMYWLVYGDALADTTNADYAKIRDDTKLPLFLKGLLKKFKDRIRTRLSTDTYTYAEACATALQVEQMVLRQESSILRSLTPSIL